MVEAYRDPNNQDLDKELRKQREEIKNEIEMDKQAKKEQEEA